jgi:hypothetical protein
MEEKRDKRVKELAVNQNKTSNLSHFESAKLRVFMFF